MASTSTDKKICCARFDPKPWEGKTHLWKDKLFVKDTVTQFFHIPLNFGKVMTRLCTAIDQAKAAAKPKDFILLAYDPSPWKSEISIAVAKEVPGFTMERLSGTFISKVFEGPYSKVPGWLKEMDAYLAAKGKTSKKTYLYYTTCPKCAKKYGENYVVVIAQL